MSREWKPGDVAVIGEGVTAIWQGNQWASSDGRYFNEWQVKDARALVVIDPEDREQVERLAGAYIKQWLGNEKPIGRTLDVTVTQMQAALREFAQPTPPKPEEPKGLGAVVEDADGRQWCRDLPHNGLGNPWLCSQRGKAPMRYRYSDIDAVKVLSEGVVS